MPAESLKWVVDFLHQNFTRVPETKHIYMMPLLTSVRPAHLKQKDSSEPGLEFLVLKTNIFQVLKSEFPQVTLYQVIP